jgi:hypothetical protein
VLEGILLRARHASHVSGYVAVGLASLIALFGCAPRTPSSVASGRPACVGLESYSAVIEQVMNIQPQWESVATGTQCYEARWVIHNDAGIHSLSAALTAEGCVCATRAASRFRGGFTQGETAGLLQGAAAAPVSQLEYTSRWLEPRTLIHCPLAFLSRSTYESEIEMHDGTIWKLSCSGSGQLGEVELATTFTVLTPECADALQ